MNKRVSQKGTLQAILLALYRAVSTSGMLHISWGRTLFEKLYRLYKGYYEVRSINLLQEWVRPSAFVIDVGANVGFFTLQFASWVTEGGKVLAIEPEEVNFTRLQRAITRARLTTIVETIKAAAADTTGEALLEINPLNPGDHKLGTKGIPVVTTTIDNLLAARGWPAVSLIKIDVQGAEARVLAGASGTIDRFRPALFFEVYDQGLRQYGSSASALLTSIESRGYTIHVLARKALSGPLTVRQALTAVEAKGYIDFLLLPAEHVT